MNLTRNFTLSELTKSDTAIRKGINNNPNAEQIEKLKALCENILQPVRDHFGRVKITSGYRSPELCTAIGSSVNSQHARAEAADFECLGGMLIIKRFKLPDAMSSSFSAMILWCLPSIKP